MRYPQDASISQPTLDRRTLLKTTGLAAAGYALSVQPIRAEAISTPDAGLKTQDLTVDRAGANIPVYLAMPETPGKYPTVIVIHEIFGQHEYLRDVARRFAKEGFVAAAPELYFRTGGTKHLKSMDEIRPIVNATPDRQVLDDLGAITKYLKSLPQSNGNVGVTGFCWGGGVTWLLVADNPEIKAGVAWYGRLANWGKGDLHPKNPMDLVDQIKAPVLGLYGAMDSGIPVMDVEEMGEALKKRGVTNEMVIYPGAQHAFHADYRPSYHEASAKDGWKRAVAWFKKHLG
ncbi:MAG: dienelactone hydrolase family protein [Deltaproteobacteria bacterium]|nr:dienelactone hydrolase family protein [Deltaproteobacteria bacterium]